MIKLGICIICYNRLESVKKLLSTLDCIKFENQVEIILSIDFSEQQIEMENAFEKYSWDDVSTRVIKYDINLGLKEHVLRCGDLSKDYDFLVLLEEDLCLSPYFENYISHSYLLSCNDERVGGVSLYSYDRNEDNKLDFRPNIDSFDNYFLQFPSSWGFAVTPKQWQDFRLWFSDNDCVSFSDDLVPKYVCNWGGKSWKKHFARYLVHKNKYFSYPRFSLTSNPGLAGSHHYGINGLYSVAICQSSRVWRLGDLNSSLSIYDVNFIPIKNCGIFDGYYSQGSNLCSSKGKYVVDNFYLGVFDIVGISAHYIKKLVFKIYGKFKGFYEC